MVALRYRIPLIVNKFHRFLNERYFIPESYHDRLMRWSLALLQPTATAIRCVIFAVVKTL